MNRAACLVVAVTFFSVAGFGAESICKSGAAERKIEVTTAEGGKPPCGVKYTKEGETEGKVLWSAQNDSAYCASKASELAAKLGGMGWQCSGDIAGAVEAAPTPKGADKAVEGKTEGN